MRSHASLSAFIKTRKGDKSIKMAAFDQGFIEHMAHSLNFDDERFIRNHNSVI